MTYLPITQLEGSIFKREAFMLTMLQCYHVSQAHMLTIKASTLTETVSEQATRVLARTPGWFYSCIPAHVVKVLVWTAIMLTV